MERLGQLWVEKLSMDFYSMNALKEIMKVLVFAPAIYYLYSLMCGYQHVLS